MKKILFLTLLFIVAVCEGKKHKKEGHHKVRRISECTVTRR